MLIDKNIKFIDDFSLVLTLSALDPFENRDSAAKSSQNAKYAQIFAAIFAFRR